MKNKAEILQIIVWIILVIIFLSLILYLTSEKLFIKKNGEFCEKIGENSKIGGSNLFALTDCRIIFEDEVYFYKIEKRDLKRCLECRAMYCSNPRLMDILNKEEFLCKNN